MPIHLPRTRSAALGAKLCFFAAGLALIPAIANSQEYAVTDLGTLGGSTSTAAAVNNVGQVVGWSQVHSNVHADPFMYSNGVMTDIFPEGSVYGGAAVGVNNLGHYVVNYNLNSSGGVVARLYTGVYPIGITTLGPAVGINDSDTVLGATDYGYWLYKDGDFNANPPEPGGSEGPIENMQPSAINNAGLVSAMCEEGDEAVPTGCIVSSTTTIWLDTDFASNVEINSVGATCGEDFNTPSGNWGATFWSRTGSRTHVYSSAQSDFDCLGLDDYGAGVGYEKRLSSGVTYGLMFDLLNGARKLNTLIPQGTENGYTVKVLIAVATSNTGYIAASCSFTKASGATKTHACLLTPNAVLILKDNILQLLVKEPSCSACATGLTSLDNTLPNPANGLTAAQKDHAATTVTKIEAELQTLHTAGEISDAQATFLMHEAEMAMAALGHPQI